MIADPGKSVFYMEHFYKNTKVLRYRSMKAFVEGAEPETKETPSQWAGTGHLIMDRNVYYNRFNTSNIVQVFYLCEQKFIGSYAFLNVFRRNFDFVKKFLEPRLYKLMNFCLQGDKL